MNARTWLFGLGLAATAVVPVSAQQITYTVEYVGALPGGTSASPAAISNAGTIVGVSSTTNSVNHAFEWTPADGLKDLGAMASTSDVQYTASAANGINGSGTVIGMGDVGSNGIERAFANVSGTFTNLGSLFPVTGTSEAYGINNSGQIVGTATSTVAGFFRNSSGPNHAFLYSNGSMTDLGTIANTDGISTAYAINNNGMVVGQSWTPLGYGYDHAFSYASGTMTDLGTLSGFDESCAVAVNDAGQIAGFLVSGQVFVRTHGFLYSGGVMRDIGTLPGSDYAKPLGMNSSGQVVGKAYDQLGRAAAFSYTQSGGMVDVSNRSAVIVSTGTATMPTAAFQGLSQAVAVNDFGVIAAVGVYADGSTRVFRLTPNTATAISISQQPQSQAVLAGGAATFSVSVLGSSGTTPTNVLYQWLKDGVALTGATNSTITIQNVQQGNVGSYAVTVTGAVNSVTSSAATLSITTASNVGRLVNLSIRSSAGSGGSTLIVGLVIGGAGTSGTKPILARGIGPALTVFGLSGILPDPVMTVFSGQTAISSNDNWSGDAQIASVSAQVGAFGLSDPNSKDAVIYSPSLAPGSYTIQITDKTGSNGIALAEVYDATQAGTFTASTPRLVNVSARTQVGTGANILIAGFVIGGQTSKTVLIRVVGPTLGQFGVGGVLADPQLALFDATPKQIAANDDWGNDPAIAAAFGKVGAFALPATSKDAALLVTLAPGAYSAQVSGVGGTTGVALVEVYEIP
jgi:probable HAF family extracellular repeat protein